MPISELNFSVVIPIYNRKETIIGVVQSVLDQEYQGFEIIIIDDGSTDNSKEAVASINDPRVHYYYQENSGACVARNYGVAVARGKYIAFLDSDDYFLSGHLQSAFDVLETHGECCVVYGRIVVDRGEGQTFLKPPRAIEPGEDMSEYLLCSGGFVQTSTVALPRLLALNVGYKEGLQFGQDTDFAIRLKAAGAVFYMLDEPQACWSDMDDPKRVSASLSPSVRLDWHKTVDELLTKKARVADEGWHVAKCYYKSGRPCKGIYLFLRAVAWGCYRPKLAMRIFLQLVVPTKLYRYGANFTVRYFKNISWLKSNL